MHSLRCTQDLITTWLSPVPSNLFQTASPDKDSLERCKVTLRLTCRVFGPLQVIRRQQGKPIPRAARSFSRKVSHNIPISHLSVHLWSNPSSNQCLRCTTIPFKLCPIRSMPMDNHCLRSSTSRKCLIPPPRLCQRQTINRQHQALHQRLCRGVKHQYLNPGVQSLLRIHMWLDQSCAIHPVRKSLT